MKITKKIGVFILSKYAFKPLLAWLYEQSWYFNVMKKWIPRLRFSTTYPVPENKNYRHWGALQKKGRAHLKIGDMVFTRDEKKLASAAIGKATGADEDFVPAHVGLVIALDPVETFEIAEMTHNDFTESTWSDLTHESTRTVIARCADFDSDYIDRVLVPTCRSFKDKVYDIKFTQGSDELICSELVFFSDIEGRLEVDLSPVIGMDPYISPMGLLKGRNVEIVWDSNKEI